GAFVCSPAWPCAWSSSCSLHAARPFFKASGQARYYGPSDWEYARLTCHCLDQQAKAARPSGQLLAVLHSMMTDLRISEGARRRVRLEIEREQAKAQVVDISSMFRENMAR